MIDGGLYHLFKRRFPDWLWSRLETGDICPGIPDAMYCTPDGVIGFLEFKIAKHWKVTFQPLQPAWISKHARYKARVFVIVKRADKSLYVISGHDVLCLAEEGLKSFSEIPGAVSYTHLTLPTNREV